MNRSRRFSQRTFMVLDASFIVILATLIVVSKVDRPTALIQTGVEWMEVGTLAMAMTAIIITGGIDLSIASVVALCVVTTGVLFDQFEWSFPASAVAAILVGTLAGATNGYAIYKGLSPLIVTLATMAVFSG